MAVSRLRIILGAMDMGRMALTEDKVVSIVIACINYV